MGIRLGKRGKYYFIEFDRNVRRSFKTLIGQHVTNRDVAEKLFNEIKKKQLYKKIAQLDSKNSLTISAFIETYTTDPTRTRKNGEGISPHTIRADKLAFRLLQEAIGDLDVHAINENEIKDFMKTTSCRVKPASLNNYLSHIRAGLNWAKDEGLLKKVPRIKLINLKKGLPRAISVDDLPALYEKAKEMRPEMEHIIRFALYTGARRHEIILAQWEHIDWKNQTIRILGKGNKERIIPLLPDAVRGKQRQDEGPLFSYSHESTISNYFRIITRACGIKARFHDLRHTAATQMLQTGIPLEVVRDILGHSDIKTTQIYAKVLANRMKQEMLKLKY